jgi:hypothetical protein
MLALQQRRYAERRRVPVQIDFHYYATYALARAAGIRREAALTIARAAQYVDDSVAETLPPGTEGIALKPEVTAHRTKDLHNTRFREATEWDDQRQVWVPFHFLPGGRGDSFSERLICSKNSPVAKDMVRHALTRVTDPFGCELLGITAHVYEDTFSHYGFSGISSRRNRVVPRSITLPRGAVDVFHPLLVEREEGLLPNWRSWLVAGLNDLGALGHGSVDVCPDQSFLTWSFRYFGYDARPEEEESSRENAASFVEAAQCIYDMFVAARRVAEASLADSAGQRPYSEIASTVEQLVHTCADTDGRSEAWSRAAGEGKLFNGHETTPHYDITGMELSRDTLWRLSGDSDAATEPAYRFYQAAAVHRWWVLRELLPRYNVVIV